MKNVQATIIFVGMKFELASWGANRTLEFC